MVWANGNILELLVALIEIDPKQPLRFLQATLSFLTKLAFSTTDGRVVKKLAAPPPVFLDSLTVCIRKMHV